MIVYGLEIAIGAILTPLLKPGNYSTSELSLIGASFSVGGILFLFIYGIILDKT